MCYKTVEDLTIQLISLPLFISRVLMEKMVEAEYPEYLYVNFYVAFVVFVIFYH